LNDNQTTTNHQNMEALMTNLFKALLAKAWKDEDANLTPGTHRIDEEFVVRLSGYVTKQADQRITPTTSVPLISVLALFWEKSGLAQDDAIRLLREAITEAMDENACKNCRIKSRIDDVTAAVEAVKKDLLAELPKVPRAGRTITKGLQISVKSLELADAVA